MKTWILFIVTILSLSSSVARAGVFEEGIEAYKNGNYAKALALLHPLASQVMTNAQNNLGWMYEEGKGVTQDYQEAAKWYHLAAEQGYAAAQGNIGYFYHMGKEMKPSQIANAQRMAQDCEKKNYKNCE